MEKKKTNIDNALYITWLLKQRVVPGTTSCKLTEEGIMHESNWL